MANLEKINKHAISNRKLLKGPSTWEAVPNQQVLLPYSFCSLSDHVPLLFTYLVCKEEILSQLKMITGLSLTWVAFTEENWDKDLFTFIRWFLWWFFWSPSAIKIILAHTPFRNFYMRNTSSTLYFSVRAYYLTWTTCSCVNSMKAEAALRHQCWSRASAGH